MSIDSAKMNVHDLRRCIIRAFSDSEAFSRLLVRLVSFGFKYGVPTDADMMFDVRFLPNPFFEDQLRARSGREASVSEFVLKHPDAQTFLQRALPLLEFCVDKFEEEGKSYVSVAIGCTGGRHRSVALAEVIASALSARLGREVKLEHRDVHRAEHSEFPRAEQPDLPRVE